MSHMPITKYPVRSIKEPGESLAGYVHRCYWENGYEVPRVLVAAIRSLYRGEDCRNAFDRIATAIPPLDEAEQAWWVTHRLDREALHGTARRWLRFHYNPVRYCPACLNEAGIHLEQWTWPLVTACSRHQCKLIEQCHACDRSLTWARIKYDWSCNCGAGLANAPLAPAAPWAMRLAAIIDKALNPIWETESQQIPLDAFSRTSEVVEIYGFIDWVYSLRCELSQSYPYKDLDKLKTWKYPAPHAWEAKLITADKGLWRRKLQSFAKWDCRYQERPLFLLHHGFSKAIKALDRLPRNRYTETLLDEVEAIRSRHRVGIESCPDVYFHPDLSIQDRQAVLSAFAQRWHAIARKVTTLESKDQLTTEEVSSINGYVNRSDLILQILHLVLNADDSEEGVDLYPMLVARWHVSKALQRVFGPEKVLNEVGGYLSGLRTSELWFVLDLMSQSDERATC